MADVSYDYLASAVVYMQDWPVNALLMAAMRKADSVNLAALRAAFPYVWDEYKSARAAAATGGE